ncbi:hypothetical protein ACFE04_002017 [Oxalis oulophora]
MNPPRRSRINGLGSRLIVVLFITRGRNTGLGKGWYTQYRDMSLCYWFHIDDTNFGEDFNRTQSSTNWSGYLWTNWVSSASLVLDFIYPCCAQPSRITIMFWIVSHAIILIPKSLYKVGRHYSGLEISNFHCNFLAENKVKNCTSNFRIISLSCLLRPQGTLYTLQILEAHITLKLCHESDGYSRSMEATSEDFDVVVVFAMSDV